MEGKVMHQKCFSGENLDDMLLASFLNDEYEELQEDVQENIFQLQDGPSESKYLKEENAQENSYNLKDEVKKANTVLSYTHRRTESEKIMTKKIKTINASSIQELVKNNISSELITSANINSNQVLGQPNGSYKTVRKRKVEVLETKQNFQESEKNHISSKEANSDKIYYENHCLEKILNNEDSRSKDKKIGILANEKITNCDEDIKFNGSMNTTDNVELSTRQDDKARLQSDNVTSLSTERGNSLECKDSLILSVKIFFVIFMFLCFLYYVIIQKR